MVTLTTVNWMHEADALCAQLESNGIGACVPDANTVTVLPLHGAALGGIRVQVEASDLARARELLRALAAAPESHPIRCPACQSADVDQRRSAWPWFAAVVLLLGIPLLWLRKQYTCRACGRAWKEPGSA